VKQIEADLGIVEVHVPMDRIEATVIGAYHLVKIKLPEAYLPEGARAERLV
jgi:hypothetical protein